MLRISVLVVNQKSAQYHNWERDCLKPKVLKHPHSMYHYSKFYMKHVSWYIVADRRIVLKHVE